MVSTDRVARRSYYITAIIFSNPVEAAKEIAKSVENENRFAFFAGCLIGIFLAITIISLLG